MIDSPKSPNERDINITGPDREMALAHWDRSHSQILGAVQATLQYELLAIRLASYTNAGALAGAVGLSKTNIVNSDLAPKLFVLFGVGLLLSMMSAWVTYFAQHALTKSLAKRQIVLIVPFVLETEDSKRLNRNGKALDIIAHLILACSIACLIWGGGLIFSDL